MPEPPMPPKLSLRLATASKGRPVPGSTRFSEFDFPDRIRAFPVPQQTAAEKRVFKKILMG
jgi:hypothetical protein